MEWASRRSYATHSLMRCYDATMSPARRKTTSDTSKREHCAAETWQHSSDPDCRRHRRHANKPVFTPCGSAINASQNKVGAMANRGEGST